MTGKLSDPQWRQERARKAVAANQAAREAYRAQIGERYPSKGDAYQAGYRLGYQVAVRRERARQRAAAAIAGLRRVL